MIDLVFDLAEFKAKARQMGVFADDQLPYAISVALNNTMFQDVRPQIIGPTWSKAFTVRNSGLARASINVEKASKASWTAGVFDALGRAHLALHADGGTLAAKGGHLAIPNRQLVRLHGRGKTPWAREMDKRVPARALRVVKGKGIFVGEGGRLHLWFAFRGSAHLAKRFAFYQDFKAKAEAGMARHFPPALQAAVATAFGR